MVDALHRLGCHGLMSSSRLSSFGSLFRTAGFALAWLVVGCASGPATGAPPAVPETSAAATSSERTGESASVGRRAASAEPDLLEDGDGQPLVLWSVEQGGIVRGYLHGSVHVLPGAQVGKQPRVDAAYEDSDVLVVEVDVAVADPSLQLLTTQLGMYPEGESLTAHVPEPLLTDVLAEVKRYQLPLSAALRMRPWLLAVTLTMLGVNEEGFSQEHGIDRRFLATAHSAAARKEVVALETAESQLRMFADLPETEQVLFLEDALLRSDGRENLQAILQAWVDGDIPGLSARLFAPLREDPTLRPLYETFYFKRNRAMANRLVELFASGNTHFVVVGAGHLVGEDSLPALLLARGFTVRRLRASPAAPAGSAAATARQ